MVTRVRLEPIIEKAQELKLPVETIEALKTAAIKDKESRKRKVKEPVPDGGIAIREAARKYNIPNVTIIGWVKRGDVKVIKVTSNWTYISESDIEKLSLTYKPGRGRKSRILAN